jgi:hypothetical protein
MSTDDSGTCVISVCHVLKLLRNIECGQHDRNLRHPQVPRLETKLDKRFHRSGASRADAADQRGALNDGRPPPVLLPLAEPLPQSREAPSPSQWRGGGEDTLTRNQPVATSDLLPAPALWRNALEIDLVT